MRLVVCSSLTKCGAGKRLWVHSPCRQCLSGCSLFRARTLSECTEYASCSLGTLFYLMCWKAADSMVCLEPYMPTCVWSGDKWGVIFHPSRHYHWVVSEPRQSDGWFKHWKYGMTVAHVILAGKFLWACQRCNCISHRWLWAARC